MSPTTKRYLTVIIPFFVSFWVILMLLSLRFGFLNIFSYSASTLNIQGIDFFSLPKSFLNLLEHRSMYDSWGGAPYGPYSTWYLAHPAFGLFVGFWFSFFKPMTSYWLFTFFSLALLFWSAYILSANTTDPLRRRICYLLILCSFPTYWVLLTGNIQAFSVLSFSLILSALFIFAYREDLSSTNSANVQLMAGLLLSFFSKPFALLFLPVLLINEKTRKTTILSLIIYIIVSAVFIFTPVLNPEAIRPGEIIRLAVNPQFVKEQMNIYQNHFILNQYMKDNSVHWFNLIAQSDYYFNHVDIFSLSAFINSLTVKILPGVIYKIPLALALLLSFILLLVKNNKKRQELSIILIMALCLTFFLSYNTVWEYQFTLFLPAVALLFLMQEQKVFFQGLIPLLLSLSVFFYLPTLSFLFRGRALDNFVLTMIRLDKIVPALIIYVILITIAGIEIVREIKV